MLAEHDRGRQCVRGMAQAGARYRAGEAAAGAAFAQNARGYATLLAQHICKEDNILYPLADQRLSAEQQAELLAGFERVEQERIGPGRREAFHRLLDDFQAIYR